MNREWQWWISWFFIVPLIALAAGALLPWILRVVNSSPYTRTYSLSKNLDHAVNNFRTEYGQWPKSFSELTNNPRNITFIKTDNSGFTDSWGRIFIFQPFDPAKGYGTITSYGRDGKPGGTGADADLEVRFGP